MKEKANAKVAQAMADLSPEALDKQARKSERLNLRVTPSEKAEMESTAAALGFTLSEYLTALHHHAAPRLVHRGGRGEKR